MNNKKFYTLFILFFSACLLQACSYSTYYVPTEQPMYPPSEPSSVLISFQRTIAYPHQDLGRVAAITWGDGEDARSHLQTEAARLGATIVYDVRVVRTFGKTMASGLAAIIYSRR